MKIFNYFVPSWVWYVVGPPITTFTSHQLFSSTIPCQVLQQTVARNHYIIPLDRILLQNYHQLPQSSKSFPKYHPLTPFHYQRFFQTPYSKIMSYPDFCVFEEKLADIVAMYLQSDTISKLYALQLDPFFLYSDSLSNYYPFLWKSEKMTIISPSTEIGHPSIIMTRLTQVSGL